METGLGGRRLAVHVCSLDVRCRWLIAVDGHPPRANYCDLSFVATNLDSDPRRAAWNHVRMIDPLEREEVLASLKEAGRQASAGLGSVSLVQGEAGLGKSSLIRSARRHWSADVQVLVGHCDDLDPPRVLGPLRDLTPHLKPELAQALRTEDRESVFAAVCAEFSHGPARVLVIEDVHWCDEATLDVLQFLIRRIAPMPLALVLTYRGEAATAEGRFRRLLGTAALAERVRHIELEPLSRAAVELMVEVSAYGSTAGSHRMDADWLHRVTGGNPFFVTEMLRCRSIPETAPPTVVDAVLARTQNLGDEVHAALEQLAVIPSTIEQWLVKALLGKQVSVLPVAEQAGVIVSTPGQVSFRHELTRRAIVDAIPGPGQVHLHRRALRALVARPQADPSRLVHHAIGAGDAEAIVRYGLAAAQDASQAGAHREAVAHYRSALAHRDQLSELELAEALERYATECHTTGDLDAAVAATLEEVELRRKGNDRRALGRALRRLSLGQALSSSGPLPDAAAQEAVEVLIEAGDDRLLALAYSHRAQLYLRASSNTEGLDNGRRAVALARTVDDPAVLSHALNNAGSAYWAMGDRDLGKSLLEESLQVALEADEAMEACRAHMNLAWSLLDDLRMDEAHFHIEAMIALAEAAEQWGKLEFIRGHQALVAFYKGDWEIVDQVVERTTDQRSPVAHELVTIVRGRVAVRRGDPEGDELLASVEDLGQVRDLLTQGLLASGRAEAAWLAGDFEAVRRHAEPIYARARRLGHRRWEEELGHWLILAGQQVAAPLSLEPYAAQGQGRVADAAAWWQAEGMPYEQAAALALSDQPDHLLTSLPIFDRLGARPQARRVRDRLRKMSVRVPRGPIVNTRGNPAGLTSRQVEIARFLGRGCSNAEIAQMLTLSVRTVDNHVAAVLAKLGVGSRHEVAEQVRRLGLDNE